MDVPVIAICGIATDETSWKGMPVDRIFVPRGVSIAAMAESILAALPDRFALCGHSMGGYVALEIARQSLTRISGLALISSSANADTAEQGIARQAVIEQARTDFAGVVDKLAPAMLSRASREKPGLLAETRKMVERCGAKLFVEQQSAAAQRRDYRDTLSTISVPTLILAGEDDRIISPDRSRELAAAIPDAQLQLVPACGHVPQREATDVAAAALEQWARSRKN